MSSFKRAARRCLADILNSITFLVEFVWTRGDLNEFGEYSMRYTDDGGCIVVAAGPTVIEVCDNRTLSLEIFNRYARKLLYTVRRESPPVILPSDRHGSLVSLNNDHSHPRKNQVRAVKSHFSLWFEPDKYIAGSLLRGRRKSCPLRIV